MTTRDMFAVLTFDQSAFTFNHIHHDHLSLTFVLWKNLKKKMQLCN